ncbi:MAG: hypothetical protein P8O87_03270 [Crocinitomicaceae bacterium]|nr:hypothetical protein [Crocinitomicaceae bacterium]
MKNIFLILAITFSSSSFAQGNLQFNQVILSEFTTSTQSSGEYITGSITVPAGKVWKVEHASVYGYGSYVMSEYGGWSLSIGNILIYRSKDNLNTIDGCDNFPIWLPSGSYNIVIGQERTGNWASVRSHINAIEFNVVP